MAFALLLGAVALGYSASALMTSQRSQEAFARDDSAKLNDDPLSLRHAYSTLRSAAVPVTLRGPSDGARLSLPPLDHALWILQLDHAWLGSLADERRAALRAFVEAGGTLLLAPRESITAIPDADPAPAEAPEAELSTFLKGFALDTQIVAFEPAPAEDTEAPSGDGETPAGDDGQAPAVLLPSDDDPPQPQQGYVLEVSTSGEHFAGIERLQTSWGNYLDGEDLLKAEIRVHSDGFPLIAEFSIGKGRLVLVAESTYFENEFLAAEHNHALWLALARAYGQRGIEIDVVGEP